MDELTHEDWQTIARSLDACTDMFRQPLSSQARARIFAAIESPTWQNWVEARSVLIRPGLSLWQLMALAGQIGVSSRDVPSRASIIDTLAQYAIPTPASQPPTAEQPVAKRASHGAAGVDEAGAPRAA